MSAINTHYRTCNICEAMCGLEIKYQEKEILSIRGNKDDVLSRGHICPKAVALQDFYSDPDRLKTPVRKTANGWESISWEVAINEVVKKISDIQSSHGQNAVGTYLGNPNAHKLGNALFMPLLLRALKTRNRFSASSVDQLPHHFASNYMFGHGNLLPVADIDHTQYMIIIGGNPMISNGSMMTCPDFPTRMKAIQKRGGKVVVIDPRKTETAKKSDEHLFIKPGSDAYLLAGMISVLLEKKKINLRHLNSIIDGVEEIQNVVSEYTPAKVEQITGIAANSIYRIVEELTASTSGVVYSRMGASTQQFGGLCIWLTNVFNILSGNFDNRGGAMFTQPAYDLVKLTSKKGRPSNYGKYQSRVKGLPYYNGEFPVATMADEILTPGEGQIRAMVTVAGNPLLSCPDAGKLKTAFESLEFYVAIDPYINETTRHADIILPGTVALEESQYDIPFNNLAVRNTVKYASPLFEKEETQRHDWEILNMLAAKLKEEDPLQLNPEMMLEMGWRAQDKEGISISTLLENPNGIDLGPLQTCLTERMQTDDGRIQLTPAPMLEDMNRLKSKLENHDNSSEEFPLLLIGRRLLRSHNTWCHNSYRLVKGRNECTVLINPDDAERYKITKGDKVTVSSVAGTLQIEAEVTDQMMAGVISIPQGWGHTDEEANLSVAKSKPGANMNLLTNGEDLDVLTGNAVLNGVAVNISQIEE
ncbi:MAG: anaerobic selenocysteine-containing dehydrogenase [Saprospiraceae bacterium]|jgi:anaerobic selenocysteine-containing dehydrogenase